MPELPEVESIRLHLHDQIIGKTVKDLTVVADRMLIGDEKKLISAKVKDTSRKGKVLVIHLENEGYKIFATIHLKLSGQLLYADDFSNAKFKRIIPRAKSDTMPAVSTRITILFDDASAIFFNDIRKLGWLRIDNKLNLPSGVDILSPDFTNKYLLRTIKTFKRPIKNILLDQNLIAGLGNIYVNDSLFVAGINPQRNTSTLTKKEILDLYKSIIDTINLGLEKKGSSAQDEIYLLPDGTPGEYQHFFKVYAQKGKICQKCKKEKIQYIKMQGRGTFFCPKCQK